MTRNKFQDTLKPIAGGNAGGSFGGGGGVAPGTDGQFLTTAGGRVGWTTPTFVTEKALDEKIEPLRTGIEHGAAVTSIITHPTGHEPHGALYIIGAPATSDFVGQENKIAFRDNGKWEFTDPRDNEAHLNEEDNQIYHWNGTKWNKIGSVAPKRPATKNIWFNVGGAGLGSTIDFGMADWLTIDMSVSFQLENAPSHLSFCLLAANDTRALTKMDCSVANQQITWLSDHSINGRAYSTKNNNFFVNENEFSLTWLAGAAGSNDRVSHTLGRFSQARITLTRHPNSKIQVAAKINYTSYGGEGYEVTSSYGFDNVAGSPLLQKMLFLCDANAHLGLSAQYTIS